MGSRGMIAIFLLAALLFALGAWLWVCAAPIFAAIQRMVRAGETNIVGDVDEANANAWALAATPAAGRRRLRFVAIACVVTGAAIAWIGASA